MVLPSTFMSKNIKKVFRKFCFFQTYSLLLLLIFSSNQRIERFTKVNRQSWLCKPHLPIKPPVLMGGGKILTIKTCWNKALLALCPWRLETSHISIWSQDEATRDAPQVKHRMNYTYTGRYSFFAIREQCEHCVFSFYSKRQCEGPQTWNKWKDQGSHSFFLFKQASHIPASLLRQSA